MMKIHTNKGVFTDPVQVDRKALLRELLLNGEVYTQAQARERILAWDVLALLYKENVFRWEPKHLEDYSNLVCTLARLALEKEPWYRGVCVNSLHDLYKDQVPPLEAADHIFRDTFFFDA